jgi:hypothetical protein
MRLLEAANNTAVIRDVRPEQRGVTSGMLNLSRNLGLITGASVVGTVFTIASGPRFSIRVGSRVVALKAAGEG